MEPLPYETCDGSFSLKERGIIDMITRIINGIEFDIDINKANELYFPADFNRSINSTGITDILFAFYNAKKEYTPESLFIELTGQCNFNCPFCYIHNCRGARDRKFKPFSEIKKDIDFLLSSGLITCTISGGECLLHPDFKELYRYLKENGVLVTILSNLTLLNSEVLDLFLELPPYKIDVTIYAMNDTSMQVITGQNTYSYNLVLDNVLSLKKNCINVTCKTPINTFTKSEIDDIRSWCETYDIPYFTSMEVFETYDGKSMEQYSMTKEEVLTDRIEAKIAKGNTTTTDKKRKINFDCKGGQYGLFISYEYSLRPCMPFYSVPEANFQIGPEGIENALERMKEFINKYKNTPLKYCEGCFHSNLCDLCIITQLSGMNTKKLVQENCLALHRFDKAST